jgi:RNA polymerase sigma-70 factor (ECF subfamily)
VAWLYRVARTTVADYWRQDQCRHLVALEEALDTGPCSPTASDVHRQADTAARARALLSRLPEIYRQVLSHRLLDGTSVAETARLMKRSEDSIKALQQRALMRAAQLHGGNRTVQKSTHQGETGSGQVLL